MKPRDLAVIAAVVLIAGFAAADALRSDPETSPPTTTARAPTSSPEQETSPTRSDFVTVPGTRGSIVVADADDCRIREFALPQGREFPLPRLVSNCRIWTPRRGARIAFGLPQRARDAVPFRFHDLNNPEDELGAFSALFGSITWDPEGRRAGWCGADRTGFDYNFFDRIRRLPDCPSAYTADGTVAYARGDTLLIEDVIAVRAPAVITQVSFANDGSIGLLLDGPRVQVYRDDRLRADLRLPRTFYGARAVFAPDNCAVIFLPRAGEQGDIHLIPLACWRGGRAPSWLGNDAAWSPDGEWIAVAEPEGISLNRVDGTAEAVLWPIRAAAIAWRR